MTTRRTRLYKLEQLSRRDLRQRKISMVGREASNNDQPTAMKNLPIGGKPCLYNVHINIGLNELPAARHDDLFKMPTTTQHLIYRGSAAIEWVFSRVVDRLQRPTQTLKPARDGYMSRFSSYKTSWYWRYITSMTHMIQMALHCLQSSIDWYSQISYSPRKLVANQPSSGCPR